MSLALIAVLPFLGAILVDVSARFGRNQMALTAGATTLAALVGILGHLPSVLRGQVIFTQIDWLPAYGLNANFMLDGLGLLFALLILGIGLLIIIYARFYLSKSDPMGNFYAYLLLFQGAMLGISLSDNILLLLVFWELTSLSSFLLIGYWKHLPEARQGARMALAITGSGGLAMFAGLLILGNIAGSYDISQMLAQKDVIQSSPLYLPALILILLGAFTKSAQMPFHFWLPHAMAAPTPVSAYLHSATMVKAGLFLMARLWPILAGTEAWFYLVATTGILTMVFAAKVALFKDDLKAILAYSTISHLGLITFLLGLGTKAAATAAVFHIICHASFKAALFMVAGIVDHEAHTRDIRKLGGLRKLMPITFVLAAIASLSMAGLPPFNGFLSKEMALEEAAHTIWLGNAWVIPILATIGAVFSVGYSLRFLVHGFFGTPRAVLTAKPHDPPLGLWISPAFLACLVVLIGFAPMTFAGWLVDAATGAVIGQEMTAKIVHWHGLGSPALWISLFAFVVGGLLLDRYSPLRGLWDRFSRGDGKRSFETLLSALTAVARATVVRFHDGALSRYIMIAVVAIVALSVYAFQGGDHAAGLRAVAPMNATAIALSVIMVIALAATVRFHHQRILALLFVGLIGLIISIGFAYLAAPDLALTQLTVEVVTVILMLQALTFLPKTSPIESSLSRRWRDGVIAVVAGLGAGGLAYVMMLRDSAFGPISAFHLEQSKPGAGGTNAVNTIIVDFRGFDTYGEIIVLGIAALVISALVEALLSQSAVKDRLMPILQNADRSGDRHPMMLVVATRFMVPIGMMVGVYIFLRGHNLPGGGFVAGLVFSIALILQYIASGHGWTAARKRINYQTMIGLGVLIATATGIGSWIFDRAFLTSNYANIEIFPLEKFEVATAALFDLGVFLCVFGGVMLALATMSRLAQKGGEATSRHAFDLRRRG